MSRGLTTANEGAVDASHVQIVLLAKFEFGTPVYVHTGVGTITYDGDDYLGVGDFGGVEGVEESSDLSPANTKFVLTGFDAALLSEALDSGTYGDVITVYEGYRKDDGSLEDDPWILWKGTYEYATAVLGDENGIAIVAQHDLARLDDKDGGRFTDEDQRNRFSGDVGLEHIHTIATQKLVWGGESTGGFSLSGGRHRRPRRGNRGGP